MLSYLTCGFVTRCDVLMYVLEQIRHSSVTCQLNHQLEVLQCKQIRRHSVAVHIPIISKVTVFITTYSPSSAARSSYALSQVYCAILFGAKRRRAKLYL